MEFAATIENGKIDIPAFREYISNLESGNYKIIITKIKNIRSLQQNAFWWAVMIPMLKKKVNEYREAHGKKPYNDKQVSDLFKLMFGLKSVEEKIFYNKTTKKYETREEEILISTRDYSTTEFSKLWEDCQQYAAEIWGLYIPDPEQDWQKQKRAA